MRLAKLCALGAAACLVTVVYRCRVASESAAPRVRLGGPRPSRPLSRSASEAPRWAACGCWARVPARSNCEREAVELRDPQAAGRLNPEPWRQQTVARDPDGELRQARFLANRARALARTPAERGSAARLQARLAYEAGDREGEVKAARRLLALEPHTAATRTALRRWAARPE